MYRKNFECLHFLVADMNCVNKVMEALEAFMAV
jgi:hypothetical protein